MTRRVPMWAATTVAFVALAVGIIIGLEWRQPPVEHLAYCSLTGSVVEGTPPCPPDTNRPVWATWAVWEGGVRTIATWDGRAWVLTNPVLGVTRTTTPPTSWSEL